MFNLFHESNISRYINNLLAVFNDKERKTLFKIVKEFTFLSYKTRCIATHYFTSFLYDRKIKNYLDYLSHKEWQLLQRLISDKEAINITGDKLYFQQYYERSPIKLPRLLAYNVKERIILVDGSKWVSREIVDQETTLDIINYLLANSKTGSIFIKPIIGTEGRGIYKISRQNKRIQHEIIKELHEDITSRSFIFQDEVIQNKELDRLNPSCTHTIRIDTFKEPGKDPEILSALIRLCKAGGYVANTRTGGFYVGINLEDGALKKTGFPKFTKGSLLYKIHPETGEVFEGFKLPYFQDVIRCAIEAANWLPKALVGWDFVISDNGPVLLEGNIVYYAMSDSDKAYGGYRKNPVFLKAIEFVGNEIGKSAEKKVNRLNM